MNNRNKIWDLYIAWFFEKLNLDEINSSYTKEEFLKGFLLGNKVSLQKTGGDVAPGFREGEILEFRDRPDTLSDYIPVKLLVGKYIEATQGLIDIARIAMENADNLPNPEVENLVRQTMKDFIKLGANPERALLESWKYLDGIMTIGRPEEDDTTSYISVVFLILLKLIKNKGTLYNEWKKLFDETKEQNAYYFGPIPLKNFIKFVIKYVDYDVLGIGADMDSDEIFETENLEYPVGIETLLRQYMIRDVAQLIQTY
jgi:hypothetical protein